MERLTKKPSTSQTSVNSPLFVEFSQVSEVAPLHIKRDAKEITNTPFLVCPLHHLRPGAGDSEQAPQTSRPPRRAAPAASSPPPRHTYHLGGRHEIRVLLYAFDVSSPYVSFHLRPPRPANIGDPPYCTVYSMHTVPNSAHAEPLARGTPPPPTH